MPGGLHPPLSVIESWPPPNYLNPVTRGHGLSILCIILFIITPSIVGARLWARIIILRKPGLDDVLICFALVRCEIWSTLSKSLRRYSDPHHRTWCLLYIGYVQALYKHNKTDSNANLAEQKFGFDRHIWDVKPAIWVPAAIVCLLTLIHIPQSVY